MKIWISLLAISLVALPLMETFRFGIHLFDSKRLVQVFIIGLGLLLLRIPNTVVISKLQLGLLAIATGSLALSVIGAGNPAMAWLESANMLGIIACCFLLSKQPISLTTFTMRVAAISAACYAVVAISHLASGIILNAPENVVGRLPGFGNIRAFNHWLTWSLPIVGALPLFRKQLANTPSYWLWLLAIIWWALFYIAAGRGSAAALLAATVIILLVMGRTAFPWARVFLTTAIFGNLLGYGWIAFESLFFASPLQSNGGILATGSSGRLAIWGEAWTLFIGSPWFGVGPMHFAHHTTGPVASPHNFILVMLSETGIIFSAILFGGIGLLGIKLLAKLRQPPSNNMVPVALACSCLAAGVHSLVSGVQLAPYSQLWLVLIVSTTIQQFTGPHSPALTRQISIPTRYLRMLAAALACILFGEALLTILDPTLPDPWAEIIGRRGPRFWSNGHF